MMKNRAFLSIAMAAMMAVSATACGSSTAAKEEPQQEAAAEETTVAVTEAAAEETTAAVETAGAEETAEATAEETFTGAPVKAFTNDGMTLSVQESVADLLVIDTPDPAEDGVLFYVSEKESLDLAAAQDQDFVGAGWLFSIGRVDEARAKEIRETDIPGMEVFAVDGNGNYYVYYHPTDVRAVREEYTEESMKSWEFLNTWAGTMTGTFVMDNEGLSTEGLTDADHLADSYAYGYFRMVGEMEQGTAGASLQTAKTACDTMRYAAVNNVHLQDYDLLRSEMLKGWESLSDEERAAFDANIMQVITLIDSCKADWESQRALFEDAGCAQTMEMLLGSASAQEAWSTLLANTLTMGNSDGA
ncbi:MAG: hypothetical protein IKG66_01365 [Lachnospiraceae bacterium]|nr:hypothetical protein [Lachnospiraceae bacterium]